VKRDSIRPLAFDYLNPMSAPLRAALQRAITWPYFFTQPVSEIRKTSHGSELYPASCGADNTLNFQAKRSDL